METLTYSETNPFFNIPQKKINNAIEDINNVHLNPKTGKLSADGATLLEIIHRYANANIPVDYWFREMDKFEGDQSLVKAYNKATISVKKSYDAGMNFCFAGAHGRGKMQDLETELPTPDRGFVKLKDLKEGDKLFDENGEVCQITKLHPIDEKPESYRITFDDLSFVDACGDHLWVTYTLYDRKSDYRNKSKTKRREKRRQQGKKHKPWLEQDDKHSKPTIKTTREILETLFVNGKQKVLNHSIPCCKPLQYPEKDLLINPYVLGCWLGDGTSKANTITSADIEILENIKNAGYNYYLIKSSDNKDNKSKLYRIGESGELTSKLRKLYIFENKNIPDEYMTSSYEQRLSLLQGLMDTDGCCYDSGRMEFCSVIHELAQKTHELALSLGIKSSINKSKSFLNGKRHKDRYRVTFTTDIPVFRLKRKLSKIRKFKNQRTKITHRFIKSVERIDPIPMRCITVNSPSHQYLVTRNCIATHNTMVATCILKRVVETGKYSSLYVNLTDIINLMASSSSVDQEIKSEARRLLLSVDFLVIDEFDSRFMGTDSATDLFGRLFEPVLRSRIQNQLPTILCTNNTEPDSLFNGALKQSFKSLMKKVETVNVLGVDFRK